MRSDKAVFAMEYWGEILSDSEGPLSISLLGFENISTANRSKREFVSPKSGSFWGFVQTGSVEVTGRGQTWNARAGQWFCLVSENGFSLKITSDDTRAFAVYSAAHVALPTMGGPVEKTGRLRYIDGCTDTILYSPPLQGDPCLNLLHFPSNVDQTQHFHPSSRCGMVSSGSGHCVFEHDEVPLRTGQIFYLPSNLRHKFKTTSAQVLDVISFHPDSDWGPTHEVHPMINRTWMDSQAT